MSTPRPPRLRLRSENRIRATREFARIRERGRRLVRGCLIANWIALPLGTPPRVGVVASRRVGPAVVRNRARRLLREAFRRHQNLLPEPVAMVLIARHSICGRPQADVDRDYLAVLRQARLTP